MIEITLRSNLLSDKRLESIHVNSFTNQAISILFAEMFLCTFCIRISNAINLLSNIVYSLLTRHSLSLMIYVKQNVLTSPILCFKKTVFCCFVGRNFRNVFKDLKCRVLSGLLINQIKFSIFYSGIGIIKYNVKINREII